MVQTVIQRINNKSKRQLPGFDQTVLRDMITYGWVNDTSVLPVEGGYQIFFRVHNQVCTLFTHNTKSPKIIATGNTLFKMLTKLQLETCTYGDDLYESISQ